MEFYTILSKYYHYIFPANLKEKKLLDNFIIEKKLVALDIGCGLGNTASFLKNHANHVIGIDLNPAMVKKASTNYPDIQFLTMDMKQLDALSLISFDVITCFGNTLVHINNKEVEDVIHQIYKQANQGAHLFVQIINYDRIYKNKITSLPTIDHEFVSMQRKYTLSDDSLIFTSIILDKKTNETATQSITLYPLLHGQLKSILENAGFEIKNSYANFEQEVWHQEAYSTIIHAKKELD